MHIFSIQQGNVERCVASATARVQGACKGRIADDTTGYIGGNIDKVKQS